MSAQLAARDITGVMHGYVQCDCRSTNVRVFDLCERPTYEQGRVVKRGGRIVGRAMRCSDCGAESQHIVRPLSSSVTESKP